MSEKSAAREQLLSEKDTIYTKYYASTIPITELGGGIEYTVNTAVKAISQFGKPTRELCNLYFGINSSVLEYMRQNGQVLVEIYVRNARPSIGSVISPEQLLANDITLNIIARLVTAGVISAARRIKDSMITKKVETALKGKISEELSDSELQHHAEKIVIKVSNSSNVKLNVDNLSPKKRSSSRKSKPKTKRKSSRRPKKAKSDRRK